VQGCGLLEIENEDDKPKRGSAMTDINISDETRNELQQLLVGEGYTPDEAREMAYSENVKPAHRLGKTVRYRSG
jgi:hypothetical protein